MIKLERGQEMGRQHMLQFRLNDKQWEYIMTPDEEGYGEKRQQNKIYQYPDSPVSRNYPKK